jgi:hypothetical protein
MTNAVCCFRCCPLPSPSSVHVPCLCFFPDSLASPLPCGLWSLYNFPLPLVFPLSTCSAFSPTNIESGVVVDGFLCGVYFAATNWCSEMPLTISAVTPPFWYQLLIWSVVARRNPFVCHMTIAYSVDFFHNLVMSFSIDFAPLLSPPGIPPRPWLGLLFGVSQS